LKSGAADGKLVSDWILLVKNRRVRWWDLAGSFLIYLLPLVVLTGCLRLHWRSWERRVFRLPRPARSQVTFLGPEFLAYTDYDGARTEVRVWRAPARLNSSHGAKSRRSSATRAATPLHEFRLDQQRQRCTVG
jgi:hypothetical protein